MRCPKCKSTSVSVVMDTAARIMESSAVRKAARTAMILGTGGIWALTAKQTGHTKTKQVALCQACGQKFNP